MMPLKALKMSLVDLARFLGGFGIALLIVGMVILTIVIDNKRDKEE